MGFDTSKLNWYLKRKHRKKNIRSDGHSQYGQDVTVFDLLGQPSTGMFMDVGANDGVTFSNSLLFEEKGWTGVCIEPHPVICQTLDEKRNCHKINEALSGEDGWVNFVMVDGPSNMLSGIAEFLDERHKKRIDGEIAEHDGSKRTIEIEALSPKTLLDRFSIKEVDYHSVDTEGCELPILKNFDFNLIPVKVLGVENGTRTPYLYEYLTSIGYRLMKSVGCDEIYMRR